MWNINFERAFQTDTDHAIIPGNELKKAKTFQTE